MQTETHTPQLLWAAGPYYIVLDMAYTHCLESLPTRRTQAAIASHRKALWAWQILSVCSCIERKRAADCQLRCQVPSYYRYRLGWRAELPWLHTLPHMLGDLQPPGLPWQPWLQHRLMRAIKCFLLLTSIMMWHITESPSCLPLSYTQRSLVSVWLGIFIWHAISNISHVPGH